MRQKEKRGIGKLTSDWVPLYNNKQSCIEYNGLWVCRLYSYQCTRVRKEYTTDDHAEHEGLHATYVAQGLFPTAAAAALLVGVVAAPALHNFRKTHGLQKAAKIKIRSRGAKQFSQISLCIRKPVKSDHSKLGWKYHSSFAISRMDLSVSLLKKNRDNKIKLHFQVKIVSEKKKTWLCLMEWTVKAGGREVGGGHLWDWSFVGNGGWVLLTPQRASSEWGQISKQHSHWTHAANVSVYSHGAE